MVSAITTTLINIVQTAVTLLTSLGLNVDQYPPQATLQNNSVYDYIVIGAGTAGSVIATRLAEDAQNSVLLLEYGGDPPATALVHNSVYDYIVIGAGTAGSVIATRLAEDAQNSVLLLEYGGDPPATALLAGAFVTLPKSNEDYDHKSTYDPYAAKSQGDYTVMTAGKMLGGSASLNHLIHTRGCRNDFDTWRELTGDDSWNYEEMLQYFIKSERVDDSEIIRAHPDYHGTDGPTGLTRQPSNKAKPYLQSFEEVGYPTVLDLNANEYLGYTEPQFIIADKVRQTPGRSYLNRVRKNSNLNLSKNTKVTRIIFEGKVAKAVEAVYDGETYIFRANKEIVLSAGVFNSPQILMLSGVGPKDHLEEMGINVVTDLPVGAGYTDQIAVTLPYRTKAHIPLLGLTSVNLDLTDVPFPVILGAGALNKSEVCPDYQVFGLIFGSDTPFLTLACHNTFWYRNDICDKLQTQVVSHDTLYIMLANLVPKSRGSICLNSPDPFDETAITTGYLTDEEDVENMIKYIKDVTKVGESKFFTEVGAKLVGLDLDECANEEQGSDDFWRCYVRNRAVSSYHYTGTCSMGSVVDGSFKLKGFEGISVVDASVIPVTPRAAPNALVIALAEKAADVIKNRNV